MLNFNTDSSMIKMNDDTSPPLPPYPRPEEGDIFDGIFYPEDDEEQP